MAQQGKNKPKNPPNNPPDDDDDDDGDGDGLTEGQTKQVLKLLNGALSGQLARKLGPAVKAELAPVLEQLQKLTPAGGRNNDDQDDDDDDDDADPVPPKNKGKGAKPDPVVTKMSKQLTALQQQVKERDDKLAKEAESRKAQKVESTLTKLLTDLGVDKNRVRGALAIHKGGAVYDEDGDKVTFKVKRDGYEEDVDAADHLKAWAGEDEGKSYLAPTGSTGGAGARPPRGNGGPQRRPAANTPEAKAEKLASAKNDLLQAVGQLTAGGSISIE